MHVPLCCFCPHWISSYMKKTHRDENCIYERRLTFVPRWAGVTVNITDRKNTCLRPAYMYLTCFLPTHMKKLYLQMTGSACRWLWRVVFLSCICLHATELMNIVYLISTSDRYCSHSNSPLGSQSHLIIPLVLKCCHCMQIHYSGKCKQL